MGRGEILTATCRALDTGGAVLLVGGAGVGKSTFLQRALDKRPHLLGQALASLTGVTYLPLCHALGGPLDGPPQEVAAAVSAALDGAILAIEDLHWADPGTRSVLGMLVGRVPMIVTSRVWPGTADAGGAWAGVGFEIPLMERRHASALARRLHPELTAVDRGRLVDAAGGNPLLLRSLVSDGRPSRTLIEAVATRVAGMRADLTESMRLLAVHGRPAPARLIGFDTDGGRAACELAEGLLDCRDGEVDFIHAAIGDAVLELTDGEERQRLHGVLAARCGDEDAVRHLLLSGDRHGAAEAARRVAPLLNPARRAAVLSSAVDALGDEADDRLLLDAAHASVQAHRPDDAERYALAVRSSDAPLVAEAAWRRAEAAWLNGELDGAAAHLDRAAASSTGTGAEVEAHVAVERAMFAARVRLGDPTVIDIARDALATAESIGIDRAKALSALGLALSHNGRTGWAELFERAGRQAAAEGDEEQVCAAAFWASSSFGLFGPMSRAIEIDDEMVLTTSTLGQRRWHHHFLGAQAVHRLGTGNGDLGLVAAARRLLTEDPLFRNRAQVDMAIAAALVDHGDFAGAAAAIETGRLHARHDEDRSLLGVAAADLAFARGDVAEMVEALRVLERCGKGFFGMNAVAEGLAAQLAFRTGEPIEVPWWDTRLLPLLSASTLEHQALDAWRDGDGVRAAALFADAAGTWEQRSFIRFAGRTWCSAATAYERLRDGVRAERCWARARALCEQASLFAVEQSLPSRGRAGAPGRPRLSARELEVMHLVGRGATSRAISDALGIAPATVESHVRNARRKLGATTRRQAAAISSGHVT